MLDLQTIQAVANGLIGTSMLLVAYTLWRVRHYRFMKGGESVVMMALGALSLDRWMTALQVDSIRLDMLPITAGLCVMACLVIASFIPELGKRINRTEFCILDKEGRRQCHLALMAAALGDKKLSGTYADLVQESRLKKAETFSQEQAGPLHAAGETESGRVR